MTDSLRRFLEAAENKQVLGAYMTVCSRPDAAVRYINMFLMRLFGRCGGCGTCVSCKKVAEGHVDILRLHAPKAAELRDALAFAAEKPYEGAYKAIVIADADGMTPAASNSLLKTLEEPPAGVVFILSVRSISGVPPTVASRCAIVAVAPEPDARTAIARTLNVDGTQAAILADLSGGFIEEAARINADAALLNRRDDILSLSHKMLYIKGMAVSTFADYLESGKEIITAQLGMMQTYFRDILVYQKTRNDTLVINRDRLEDIRRAADDFTSGAISNMIKVILDTERRFFVAVNFRLTIEKMLFCMLEERNKWKKS